MLATPSKPAAGGRLSLRNMAAAVLDIMVTGGIACWGLDDGQADTEQLVSLFEQTALIGTLLLTVAYPSYQEASGWCAAVDAAQPGLGTAFLVTTSMSVFFNIACSILSIFWIIGCNSCASYAQLELFHRSARWPLRGTYMCLVVGCLSAATALWPRLEPPRLRCAPATSVFVAPCGSSSCWKVRSVCTAITRLILTTRNSLLSVLLLRWLRADEEKRWLPRPCPSPWSP